MTIFVRLFAVVNYKDLLERLISAHKLHCRSRAAVVIAPSLRR